MLRTDPIARFNFISRVVALVAMTTLVIGSLLVRPETGADFGQVYMAGLIARHGAWDSLYPIPRDDTALNPGAVTASDMRPRYAELARDYGVGDQNRFMQPPPVALLYVPVSLPPYNVAYWSWIALMMLCMWGVAIHAGKFFELASGHASRWSGVLVLIVAVSPLAYRTLRTTQVSPLLALLISVAILDLVRRDSFRSALSIIVAGIIKYVGGALVPLVLAMRRWRAFAWLAGMSIVTLGACLVVMGTDPFVTFAREIAPTLARTHPWRGNQSLQGMLLRFTGETGFPRTVAIAQWLSLIGIVVLLIRQARIGWSAPTVFASATLLLSWMLVFSPIYWEHYAVYLCPLWGWLIYEAQQSRGRAIVATITIALLWFPLAVLPGLNLPEPLVSHMLIATLLMAALALWRLSARSNTQTTRARSPADDSARYSAAVPRP